MKLAIVFLFSFVMFASDTLANFDAVCSVDSVTSATDHRHVVYNVPCRNDDMPQSGFNNHWRITLLYPVNISFPTTADYVEARTTEGGYIISSILWGSVEIKAQDPTVAAKFTASKSREIRPQRITVTPTAKGTVIMIEERTYDFDGKNPSSCWLADHELAMRLMSDAH